jgi:hypothetical protein
MGEGQKGRGKWGGALPSAFSLEMQKKKKGK